MDEDKQSDEMEKCAPSKEVRHGVNGSTESKKMLDHSKAIASLRRRLADKPRFPVSSTELIDEDRQG